MDGLFYKAFEEKFRGSRDLIKSRLRFYIDIVSPLKDIYVEPNAVDLGCGRGEWLEVISELGFNAHGVDIDEGMLKDCQQHNLSYTKQDALEYLESLPDESVTLITAFHLAEHLRHEVLLQLTSEAKRVLKPCGLLIMETPNPENIFVGINNFYLDPTHIRPIPIGLLSFIAEYTGFSRTKVLRLQDNKELLSSENIEIMDIIDGASPDYAVLSQKDGPQESLDLFDDSFSKDYGLSLPDIGDAYEKSKADIIDKLSLTIESQSQQLESQSQQLEQLSHLKRVIQLVKLIKWLIKLPSGGMKWFIRLIKRIYFSIKQILKSIIRRAIIIFSAMPVIKSIANSILKRFPKMKNRLKSMKTKLIIENGYPLQYQKTTKGLEFAPHPQVFPVTPSLPETLFLPMHGVTPKQWVRITGHIEGHYSLAIVNRGLAAALENINQGRLSFVPYHGQAYDRMPSLESDQEALLHKALKRDIPGEATGETLSVVHHYPFIVDDKPACLRGIIFFWEETSVPAATIDHINKNFDLVWVASKFVKRALLNSGCRLPVFVIPVGIDHLIQPDTVPIDVLEVSEGQRFRFLHVSSAFERKGLDTLLTAYLDTFTADDEVELYIKTFPNPHNHVHAQLEKLRAGLSKPARIIIDETQLDDSTMLALYRNSHAMVLPSRGEGFNLPAAEALAMGLPVITTGHGAHTDFCTADTATLLNFQFAASQSHIRASDACWIEPDIKDLSTKLRKMFKIILSGDKALEAKRLAGLRHIRDTYRWVNSAKCMLSSANWLLSQPVGEPKPIRIALLSPWNTQCGIAEYSHKLMTAMVNNPDVDLSIYCDSRTTVPSENAKVSWALNDSNSVQKVLEQIDKSDVQVILVQHQPSFFPLADEICEKLANLNKRGCAVILELHSTRPLLEECRVSEEAVSMLMQLDRIIVHKPEDLNHMLALGLSENVMLLQLGAIQPLADPQSTETRTKLGIPDDSIVLGSFGFALPHKGIDTLVESLKPLAATLGHDVYLLALNSILDERSDNVIRQCRKRATQLGIDEKIRWITDYQPIEDCQKLLGVADYIIFPYKHTRESASAAVTVGLSTLKPVLVSPLEIFSDLTEVTCRMGGYEVKDIISAVQSLHGSQTAANLAERQYDWLRSRDWNLLSERLLSVMQALRRERKLNDFISTAQQEWQSDWLKNRQKQLFVDVSELYFRDARTGIQRVVHNILKELILSSPSGYEVYPVYGDKKNGYRHTGKFYNTGAYLLDEEPVIINPGDIFLGLDLSAHLFPEIEKHLVNYRNAGAKIYYVVYDIIPLRYPQFSIPAITEAFKHWISGIGRNADWLICISNTTAQDVKGWLTNQASGTSLPTINYFHLGADIDEAIATKGLPDNADNILYLMKNAEVCFIMVGTIEPRKGYEQTLHALEIIWAEGLDVRLVIVGKQGWKMEKFVDRINKNQELNDKLLWIKNASDQYLEELYKHADCLIASSFCEGFGLPLIEAARHKLPIIARNIEVFREVAGNNAFYFDSLAPDVLAEAIKEWIVLYQKGQNPRSEEISYYTWKESAAELTELIVRKS